MGAIEHLTISLPAEMVARLRDRVRAGEFADESAVIEDALADAEAIQLAEALAPLMSDEEADQWVRTEVTAALEEYDRDPSSAVSADQILADLAADRIAVESGR